MNNVPSIAAFHAWRRERKALDRLALANRDLTDAEMAPEYEALERLASVTATSAKGLSLQILASFALLADQSPSGDPIDAASYEFNAWADDMDGKMMRSILAGARGLAEREIGPG